MIVRRVWTVIAMGSAMLTMPASAADPAGGLLGLWRTQQHDGIVQIYRCGALLCGRIAGSASLRANPDQRDVHNKDPAMRKRRVLHLPVLQNLAGGPNTWTGGPMYDPVTGSGASKGVIALEGRDTLKVKGCIAMFLCRTQRWKRVP